LSSVGCQIGSTPAPSAFRILPRLLLARGAATA